MSRVGKIVTIKIMKEQYPQQWKPSFFIGIVLSEDKKSIQILGNDGSKISILLKDVFEIQEKD